MIRLKNISFAAHFSNFIVAGFVLIAFTGCKTVAEATDPVPTVTNSREQFESLFHDALSEKMLGHYDKSIALFEQCLVLEPNNGAVHFALSELYGSPVMGNAVKAIQHGSSAYNTDITNKWYALNLARLYYGVGDYQNSAKYYDIAIDEEEQNLELKYEYTEVLIRTESYEKAIVMIDEIELETGRLPELTLAKHDMYMILGEPEKAEAEIQLLLTENPQNIEYRAVLGIYYLGKEDLKKALQMGDQMVAINPENGEGYFMRADTELRLKNTQRAFEQYQQGFSKESVSLDRKLEIIWSLSALPFDRSNPDAAIAEAGMEKLFAAVYDPALKSESLHTYYGNFLLNQGKTEEALKQFKIVCDLNASDFTFWNQLLFLESELGAFDDLFTDAQKAIELFPSQPVFYLHAGIGGYKSGKYNQAEEFLFIGKDLVVNNPDLLADFYIHLGNLYGVQKKYTEGYSYFEQAKQANPQSGKAYGYQALYLLEEGKVADAETIAKAGVSINPYDAASLHAYGMVLLHRKDYKGALEKLESAAVHDQKNGLILEHYGDALFLNGQKDKAVDMWIEARNHGNHSELLKRKIADKNYYEN